VTMITESSTLTVGLVIALLSGIGWLWHMVASARKESETVRLESAVLMAELRTKMDAALTMLSTLTATQNDLEKKYAELDKRLYVVETSMEQD
jgi:hypothetical protein